MKTGNGHAHEAVLMGVVCVKPSPPDPPEPDSEGDHNKEHPNSNHKLPTGYSVRGSCDGVPLAAKPMLLFVNPLLGLLVLVRREVGMRDLSLHVVKLAILKIAPFVIADHHFALAIQPMKPK
jgi:hypothetical protein